MLGHKVGIGSQSGRPVIDDPVQSTIHPWLPRKGLRGLLTYILAARTVHGSCVQLWTGMSVCGHPRFVCTYTYSIEDDGAGIIYPDEV